MGVKIFHTLNVAVSLRTDRQSVGVPGLHIAQLGHGERLHRLRDLLPRQAQLQAPLKHTRLDRLLVSDCCRAFWGTVHVRLEIFIEEGESATGFGGNASIT